MENSVRVGVGVYIINKQRQILLGLRKGAHGFGQWCPPGGHLEYGESNEEAVVREAKEETGLNISPEDVILAGVTNDFYTDNGRHYITLHFVCRKFTGKPQLSEPDKCTEWRWFDIDKLPDNLLLSNRHFFENYPGILSAGCNC